MLVVFTCKQCLSRDSEEKLIEKCIFQKMEGIVPLGTTMDSESQRTRDLGSYDAYASYMKFIDRWSTPAGQSTPDWVVEDDFCDLIWYLGFGPDCPEETKVYWRKIQKGNYCGDDGRKRLRTSIINVLERDGLHCRLQDIRCPVLWLHVRAIPSPGGCFTMSEWKS